MEDQPSILELVREGSANKNKSARAFTGTCFDVVGWNPTWDPETMVYLVFQQEKCPTSGKEHIQFFIRVKKPIKFTGVQKLLGLKQGTSWLMVSRGSDEDNQKYCTKPASRVEGGKAGEHGKPQAGGQGSRSDLLSIAEAALDPKLSKRQFAEAFPTAILRFGRGVEKLQFMAQQKRSEPPLVRIYWGPTGAGKTRLAYQEASECGEVYMKNMENKWWDGYEPGMPVIIDDFRDKQCDIIWILNFIDRYPRQYGKTANVHPRSTACARFPESLGSARVLFLAVTSHKSQVTGVIETPVTLDTTDQSCRRDQGRHNSVQLTRDLDYYQPQPARLVQGCQA